MVGEKEGSEETSRLGRGPKNGRSQQKISLRLNPQTLKIDKEKKQTKFIIQMSEYDVCFFS